MIRAVTKTLIIIIYFQDYMTAFNFANEDEAKVLRNILIEKIELRKQKREGLYLH